MEGETKIVQKCEEKLLSLTFLDGTSKVTVVQGKVCLRLSPVQPSDPRHGEKEEK